MKPLIPILSMGLAWAGLAVAEDAPAVVRFSNNDRLSGALDSLTADLLVWKSPVLEKPTPFFLKDVLDLSLPGTLPESTADHEATLSLMGGDTVRGQLASVTDETVSLDTWFAGRMNFNRLMVAGLKIEGKSAFLYRGPTGLEGWTQSDEKPVWSYSASAFRSKAAGGIARNDVLPEECAVTFDIAWKGDSLGLKVIVFSDDPSSDAPSSGYEISFQRGSIYLRNCKTSSFLGSTHEQTLMENDRARVEIRASSKSGKVCLLINDRIVEAWSDPDVGRGKFGRCLHFVAQNTTPLRVSGIGIAPWDGVLDRMPEPRVGMMRQFGFQGQGQGEEAKPAPQEKPAEGRMELANGDSLEGEVVSIHEGVITVKTPFGEVKVPVARLRTVALKKVDLERCIRRNGDIRAWFSDGSSIVFRLDSVGDGTLTGSSQNFGTATFKIAAFNRIEFNIHDRELEEKRDTADW
jgi:hypothetical protein